jgi:uncharacterized Ntn-hydrolase superfamily protein
MTFSIVARDPVTGAFGVATATGGPAVGALVPHTRQGLGAAATQAMTNPYLAIDALDHLREEGAETALDNALARDADADMRQLILVDATGETSAWTGRKCIGFAGHLLGDGVAVAGNLLAGPSVLDAMLSTFVRSLPSGFAPALLQALEAGAEQGGDSRGINSAALLVHGKQAYADIDLRIDLSDNPLAAMRELLAATLRGPYADFFAQIPKR